MSNDNIFNQIPDLNYEEKVASIDPKEFGKVVESRRSVRVYDQDIEVPQEVMREVLNWSLLAPNSSNLQCWEFIWVRSPKERSLLIEYCFSQPAAKTAKELVVAVAKPTWWKKHSKEMLDEFERLEQQGQVVPKAAKVYYQKLVPFIYTQGFLSLFGYFKKALFFVIGFFKVVPRQPTSHQELKKWAVKSSALACQNFMMGMTAHGFDTCPMEGFDEHKVKKLLNIHRKDEVTMVISCGKRAKSGVYGSRVRFPQVRFIREV